MFIDRRWDTENYIPVCHAKKATFKSSTYTFKPFAAAPSLVDCHSNRNRPFDIFSLMRDTENYGLIHCPFTNRHETALLPYPISNTAPYVSLVLNAIPRTALPYFPEGTTMNVGQLRFI